MFWLITTQFQITNSQFHKNLTKKLLHQEWHPCNILQRHTRATHHCAQRVVCYMNRQFYFVRYSLVQPAQQCPATCQVKAAPVYIGSQFGGCAFQCLQYRLFYFKDRFVERLSYFLVRHHYLLRYARYKVTAVHRYIIGRVV